MQKITMLVSVGKSLPLTLLKLEGDEEELREVSA